MDFQIDYEKVGMRVKEMRIAKKMTQEELSDLCGCSPKHISVLETGKGGVSLDMLYRICIFLNVSMDYLMMDSSASEPETLINTSIAGKLQQCDNNMLDVVDDMIDHLLQYREKMTAEIERKSK